jgi:hypothetical protein
LQYVSFVNSAVGVLHIVQFSQNHRLQTGKALSQRRDAIAIIPHRQIHQIGTSFQ